jgi:hypothetical protein
MVHGRMVLTHLEVDSGMVHCKHDDSKSQSFEN